MVLRNPNNAMGVGSVASKRMPPRARNMPIRSGSTPRMRKAAPGGHAPAMPKK